MKKNKISQKNGYSQNHRNSIKYKRKSLDFVEEMKYGG